MVRSQLQKKSGHPIETRLAFTDYRNYTSYDQKPASLAIAPTLSKPFDFTFLPTAQLISPRSLRQSATRILPAERHSLVRNQLRNLI